jgi:hypothetical protein
MASVRKRIKVIKTRSLMGAAAVVAQGQPLLLSRYKVEREDVQKNNRVYRGVRVAVLRGKAPVFIRGAFQPWGKEGQKGMMYTRDGGEGRESGIRALFGPSPTSYLNDEKVKGAIIKSTRENIERAVIEATENQAKQLGLL